MKESASFGLHTFDFEEYGIHVTVDRFIETRGDWHGYIRIKGNTAVHPQLQGSHIIFHKINLSSGNSRKSLSRTLESRLELNGAWEEILEEVCTRSILRRWEGAPLKKIGRQERPSDAPYLLYPVIREGAPTVLYGEGGLGKSYCSLLFSILIQYGISMGKFAPKSGNVLYLDWESSESDLNARCAALSKGLGIDAELYYRNCWVPFIDDINTINTMVTENNIKLIIVDAKAAAIGGAINESQPTINLFNGLRSLGVTSLIIDHVSKESSRGPIGSVFNVNAARDVWELRATQQPASSSSKMFFYHRKTNSGRRHSPFGLHFRFEDDENQNIESVWVSETEVEADPDARKGLSIPEQIGAILKDSMQFDMSGGISYLPMSKEEIAEAIPQSNIKTITARLSDNRFNGVLWERVKGAAGLYIYRNGVTENVTDY